jgi:hypothetical protein
MKYASCQAIHGSGGGGGVRPEGSAGGGGDRSNARVCLLFFLLGDESDLYLIVRGMFLQKVPHVKTFDLGRASIIRRRSVG